MPPPMVRGSCLTGHIVVGGDQRLDSRAVGCDVKRQPAGQVLQVGSVAADLGRDGGHLLGVGIGGIAAIEVWRITPSFISIVPLIMVSGSNRPCRLRQCPGHCRRWRRAGCAAPAGRHPPAGCRRRLEQAVHDQADGVDGASGMGGVSALAQQMMVEPPSPASKVTPSVWTRAPAATCTVEARSGTALSHAALKGGDDAVQLGADDLAVEAALPPLQTGELGIRSEAESGHRVMLGSQSTSCMLVSCAGAKQGAYGGASAVHAAVGKYFSAYRHRDAGSALSSATPRPNSQPSRHASGRCRGRRPSR